MRTDAIILHTQSWHEWDLLAHCYTEQTGIITAIAKGALKDGSVQAMHVDQGNIVRAELVSGKGMPILTGTQAIRTFSNVRTHLARQAATWALLESVRALVVAPERDEQLWALLTYALGAFDTCRTDDILQELRDTQRAMLGVLGYAPHMSTCGVCGVSPNGEHASFSIELGSVVCTRCAHSGWHGTVLSEDDRSWLAGRHTAAPCAIRAVRAPTEQLIEYVSGRPLRSLELLFSVLGA